MRKLNFACLENNEKRSNSFDFLHFIDTHGPMLTVSLCQLFWQKYAESSILRFQGRRSGWPEELGTKADPPAASTQTAGLCNMLDASS